ncbi:ATP-binding cassette domain-containing protein [Psychromarinibacter sp. C21-152]|uniref:ATP-binding cassette domain-containing protein n=1 Tax=Psychromarinibacter sediminicola TaxID=3033385 RepID=A0AAE3T9S1_9RHOB|nr:ATP-binding cassette domain-containing protein [Psychromarinibacter sediminicola]MDF0600835.1 ATP-binding cassette domain-containing protein [Psychromarinibacter sediminicola]
MALPLRVTGLDVRSPRGRTILSVEDLQLPAGALLGVRGPSGAGKSTLLYAIAGLWPQAAGAVHWGDTDVMGLGEARRTAFRAANIGMIFQDFLLFEELSAQDNAALTSLFRPRDRRRQVGERARTRLAALSLPETARPVASFSGGERQRVAVARALAHDPAILLADEPTASLHREAADRLIHDLTALAKDSGTTLIAVSHDVALLSRMDRVLTVQDGRIARGESGVA